MDPALLDLLTKGGAIGTLLVVGWLFLSGKIVLAREVTKEVEHRQEISDDYRERIGKLEADRDKYLETMHKLLGISERIAAAVKDRDDRI